MGSDGPSISDVWNESVQLAKVKANEALWERRASGAVEPTRYGGSPMAGKKDYDATKNLPEGEPTQVLPKGTKTGLPKRRDVFRALDKIVKKSG